MSSQTNTMSIYIRIPFSLTAGGLVLLSGFTLRSTSLQWGMLSLLLFGYLFITWMRQSWWTWGKYVFVVGGLCALLIALRLLNGLTLSGNMLFIPLLLLLAREQRKPLRPLTLLLAGVVFAAMAVASFPAPFMQPLLLDSGALYICIRAINIYKEANLLSQQHVQELALAHAELQHMYEALQEASLYSLRSATLAERARLARDMHDGLGHQLTSLIVQLQALELMLPGEPEQAARPVPAMLEIARQAMAEVRQAVRAWSEDERGLGLTALRGLASQWAARASLALEFRQDDDLSAWPVETSVTLYRILQEALTNIVRHASATTASIEVREDQQAVIMTVADNGSYNETAGFVTGFGTRGMIERAQAAGGTCSFSQNQGQGLRVQVRLPLEPPHQDQLPTSNGGYP